LHRSNSPFLFYWQEEPINFSATHRDEVKAKQFMARVFMIPNATSAEETDAIYTEYFTDLSKNSNQDFSKVPFRDAFCHPL
jgi:methylglyoxal synthase